MSKVLVVEDVLIDKEQFRKILRRNGYEFLLASTPEEAYSVVLQKRPDAVLCEVMLGRESYETHRDSLAEVALRLANDGLIAPPRIICMSVCLDQRKRCEDAGFPFFDKNAGIEELYKMVDEALIT